MAEEVQSETGFVLYRVQRGKHHKQIKSLKGFSGVYEIRIDFDKDTYRTVYVLNLGDKIYVLHVFEKKSKKGISTPKQELDIIRTRLKRAQKEADDE